ncbi:Sec-independent protein translocase subunit TatA [Solicola sp. PLA-1-18]|uniref:Sec-independent protein translocase subunit TatA n=1 Tax=Solicola sp. PLA-1-18 TaxID=3380532 RepID=UPI003B78BFBC
MGNLGPTEIILILLVVVLLFGAKKLPELARGSGRALRIFKSETSGLMSDDDDEKTKAVDDPAAKPQRAAQPQQLPRESGATGAETPEESLRRLQRDDNA